MFKLIHESKGYDGQTFSAPPKRIEMTLDTEDADLNELCEFFGDFLKACTFHYDGRVDIVDYDSDTLASLSNEFDGLVDDLRNTENPDTTGDEMSDDSQTKFEFPPDIVPVDETSVPSPEVKQ